MRLVERSGLCVFNSIQWLRVQTNVMHCAGVSLPANEIGSVGAAKLVGALRHNTALTTLLLGSALGWLNRLFPAV